MNRATKYLVMALFIGVVCANVSARQLEKVSKELMDQKPLSLPPMPLTSPLPIIPPMPSTLPTPLIPPVELPLPITEGEAVSATKEGRVSKETKLGISISKTAATNGIGAELSSVTAKTSAYNSEYSNANAAAGPGGPSAEASGSVHKRTNGSVTAEGPNASASSGSSAYGSTGSSAAAGPDGATSSGYAYGDAYSGAGGSTTP